jgi:pimeloyl-ACP methyl ester carboxylesterase
MPFEEIDGLKIFYQDLPEDKSAIDLSGRAPVFFLHGFTLDHRMWQAQAEFFQHDYRVVIPDSRGHGESDSPQTGYSRDHRVEELAALVHLLGFDRIHLVGLSMGGSTAIGFALKYQDRLESLTLVDTGAAGYSVGPKIARIDRIAREVGVEAAREKWIKTALTWYHDDRKEIRDLMDNMMRHHRGAIWLDPQRGKYPGTVDLDHVHNITIPTMIFVGEDDRVFVPLAQQLHERIQSSVLSVFEGTGHMLNLEQPQRFNQALKVFLEQSSERG